MIKLDKEYFEKKWLKILQIQHGASDAFSPLVKQIAILHQIALDAAEAQKVADETAVKNVFELADNGGKIAMLMCAISRIQSATVEFPHD